MFFNNNLKDEMNEISNDSCSEQRQQKHYLHTFSHGTNNKMNK